MSGFSRFAEVLEALEPFDSLVLWVAMDMPIFGLD
jgi:hypothetical protein